MTAAGDSRSLFLTSGFSSPKSLVERCGKTVIQRAIESYVMNEQLSCVAINEDEQRIWPIREQIRIHSPDLRVVEVASTVKGALATAMLAIECAHPDEPLVVAAGDSEIVGGIQGSIDSLRQAHHAAGAIVFPSTNPRWSYIATSGENRVLMAAEKRVIGPYATTGVFYFESASLFAEAAEWCFVNSASHKGSYFVSAALNFVVRQGLSVGYHVIDGSLYEPSGLPADFVDSGAR